MRLEEQMDLKGQLGSFAEGKKPVEIRSTSDECRRCDEKQVSVNSAALGEWCKL